MSTFALFILGSFFLGIYLWDKKPYIAYIVMFVISVFMAYAYIGLGQI